MALAAASICFAFVGYLYTSRSSPTTRLTAHGKPHSDGKSVSASASQTSAVLPPHIDGLIRKASWDDADWDTIVNYLGSDHPGELHQIVEGEYRRRLRPEIRGTTESRSLGNAVLELIDSTEAQRLFDQVLNGNSLERTAAAHKLAESQIPEDITSAWLQLYSQQRDPNVRAAILSALQNSESPRFKELLLAGLRSDAPRELEAALSVLLTQGNYMKTLPRDYLPALSDLRLSGHSSDVTVNLYRVIGNYARDKDETSQAWLKEDALGTQSELGQLHALKQLPSFTPDLPAVLEKLRDHPSKDVREVVLYRAADLVMSKQSLQALTVLTSYLTPQDNADFQSRALDNLWRAVPFLVWWKEGGPEAKSTIDTAISSFVATNQSPALLEKAKRVLDRLAELK